MSNYESLMFLKEHIFYFNNISDEDFNRLLILENNDFIFDINYMYKATPLLKQIAEYAAISCVLSNTEKDIIDLLLENQNEELLSNTLDFTDCCYFYMSKLIDNHCSHPSVTNLKCIEYINKLYEDIMDSFVEVIENLPNQLLEPEFFNLFSSVDDRVCDNIDISFRKIILKLDEYSINTSKQLLIELKRYITDIFSNKALLNNVASYSSLDNNMIFLFNSSQIDNLSKIISIINNLNNEQIDKKHKYLLDNLINNYILYSNYRYYYLESDLQQKKYLLKCI